MHREEMTWAMMGVVPYREAMASMEKAADKVAGGEPGRVFILEHPPVITLGRRAGLDSLKARAGDISEMGVAIEKSDRGGLATYHGPGQIVCYPVLDLKKIGVGVGEYVEKLLGVALKSLEAWGVKDCEVRMDRPGVWTKRGKIAAVGLRVSAGVVTHGFAINLEVEKKHFEAIIPCGVSGAETAQVADFVSPPGMVAAAREIAKNFGEIFNVTMIEKECKEFPGREQAAA